jgi:hypothetical protein
MHPRANTESLSMVREVLWTVAPFALRCTPTSEMLRWKNINWPLYHWTLRALPRGRELKGSMMLQFWCSDLALPTKSFRLLPETDLHVPTPKDLHESTDPKESGGTQIEKWVTTCMQDHLGCSRMWHDQRSSPFFLLTRLWPLSQLPELLHSEPNGRRPS